jgi:hypothetical protein
VKLAIAYSTKDRVELTEQTFPILRDGQHALFWCDGSTTYEGRAFFFKNSAYTTHPPSHVTGGADTAIAWKLSKMLALPANYTHIGLLENDVLLDPDWLEPTFELFEKGKADGLDVGAVSPRSYVDRVLIQRDGYAVMHNTGAGVVIFTREAAEIVLRSFRTHWWPDNVRLFAQISGIDLRTYAAFRGQEQFVTTDWGWEAQLARHGLASLALTPAKVQMIGQVPPLAEQGLQLTMGAVSHLWRDDLFKVYRDNLAAIRQHRVKLDGLNIIHRDASGGQLFFPHQLGYLVGAKWAGTLALKWTNGYGPFAYRAGPGGASLSVRISSSCCFLVSGGAVGSKVTVEDTRSGFKFAPDLPPEADNPISISVPGGPVPRTVTMDMSEGAVFYGLQTADSQMIDTTFRFDWSQLPPSEVK